eukprot:40304-Lingulodinium_polyedra.AAC.1
MDVATSFAEKMAKDEKIAGVKRGVYLGQAYVDVEFRFMKDPKAMVEFVKKEIGDNGFVIPPYSPSHNECKQ